MSAAANFEPKIIGFLCNWCSYAGADKAGGLQQAYPPNVHVVRVMCSGRVDPSFILSALVNGADGVIILACHPGDCHYKEGNCRALQRHVILSKVLRQMGVAPERCRLDYISAGEGGKFSRLISETVDSIRALGPLLIGDVEEVHQSSIKRE